MPLTHIPSFEKPVTAKEISPIQWEVLRCVIAERYGFRLHDSWAGQVVARLSERATATGRSGIDDYLQWLLNPTTPADEMPMLVESLLNGETHFLRTEPHFSALINTVVPAWRATRSPGQHLRIVSLGCSTGEEPYSIALVLHEILSKDELACLEVTGVDVSKKSLAVAKAGRYESYQLRELTPLQRQRWFSAAKDKWVIDPALCASIRFFQHNLLEPLPFAGLDVIFCRNVLIYFRRVAVEFCYLEFHMALRPGGYLFLGHSESAFGYPEYFEPVQVRDGVIYQNKPSYNSFS